MRTGNGCFEFEGHYMISPLDTRITYFGNLANVAVVEGLARLRGAGYDIVAGTHDPRDAPFLRAAGIPYVSDRIEALSDSQIIITAMPAPPQVEEIYLGEQGLIELAEPGTYLLDLSVSTPQLAREIHAMASVADLFAVDAPLVNLGEKEASTLYVGGEQAAVNELMPLFPYLAETVYPQSEPGDGQFAAMLANIALAGSLMGAIEALALAHIAGFPEKAALNALATSSGGSRALIDFIPRVLAHDYSGRIKVGEFLDALGVALDAADAMDVTIPMVETAYQLYDLLSVVGGEEMNIQAVALLYEDEKTCSDYGLDWTLADNMQLGQDQDLHTETLEEYLRRNFGNDGGEDVDLPGPYGNGPHDGGPFGGYPPMGGFFSRN